MSLSKILLEKNGMKITKENETLYTIEFEIANANADMDLTNFITIDFLKLVYDLNTDIFESITIKKNDECTADILLVYKDLFADLGLPHFYCCFRVMQNANAFVLLPHDFTPTDTKRKLVLMPLDKGEIVFRPISAQQILFHWTLGFTPPDFFSAYIEKMVSLLLYKVLNRVKQFISNMK